MIPASNNRPATTASLYVGDLEPSVSEALLYEVFKTIGPVSSIRVCRDAVTRQSLGYAYVNFHKVQDAERALDNLNFTQIKGKPCRIMWSRRDPSVRRSGAGNIFIKNLHEEIDNQQLFATFSQFGNILSCKVVVDDEGKSKGYGFVHFESEEAANQAISQVNGNELEGKVLYVAHFRPKKERQEKFTNVYAKNLPDSVNDDEALKKMFEPYGTIQSAKIMTDEEGKSKGFGFVNFETTEAAQEAVNKLNGEKPEGCEEPLYVARAQKKMERQQVLKSIRSERAQKYQGINLYIKNLDESVDDAKLREVFTPFGDITSAVVMKNEKGASKCFGFVCFSSPEEAQRAITEMNNKIIASKPIFVTLAEPKDMRRSRLEAQFQARAAQRIAPGQAMAPGQHMYPSQPMYFPAGPGGAPGGRGYPMQGYGAPGMAVPRGRAAYGPGAVNQRGFNGVPGGSVGGHPAPQRRGNHNRRAGAGRGAVNKPAETVLNLASIESMSKEQRDEVIGNQLYPLVASHTPNADLCAQVTGMLLESVPPEELVKLLQREDELESKVKEALKVYNDSQKEAKAE